MKVLKLLFCLLAVQLAYVVFAHDLGTQSGERRSLVCGSWGNNCLVDRSKLEDLEEEIANAEIELGIPSTEEKSLGCWLPGNCLESKEDILSREEYLKSLQNQLNGGHDQGTQNGERRSLVCGSWGNNCLVDRSKLEDLEGEIASVEIELGIPSTEEKSLGCWLPGNCVESKEDILNREEYLKSLQKQLNERETAVKQPENHNQNAGKAK